MARTATRERDGRGDRAPLTGRGPRATLSTMAVGERGPAVNRRELAAYLDRIRDRWPVEIALLGGARVADERGAPPQRERGPEFVVVLVSPIFDGMPWLERVYQAGNLWDALELGAPADVHCYTPAEFERRRGTLPAVRDAAEQGLDLLSL